MLSTLTIRGCVGTLAARYRQIGVLRKRIDLHVVDDNLVRRDADHGGDPGVKAVDVDGGGAFGGGVSAPAVLQKIDPQYPESARLGKFSGSVLLSTVVDVDGTPRDITLMRSAGFGLDEKAVEALAQRHFKPGTMNGRPVPVRAQIEVNFRLL